MNKCPRCGEGNLRMRVVASIFVSAKFYGNLSKTNLIRSGDAKIEGIDWDKTRIYCFKCGWFSALPGEK